MRVLIEGFGPDAVALACFLSAEGHGVRLAGSGETLEQAVAADLVDRGVTIVPSADLDADPGPADVAYLDPWTPETAPRVMGLRAQGTRLSCLGDVLLERWPGRSIGITGTAGKTSTTALTAEILQGAGIAAAVSRGARAGNLWPTGDLLERLPPGTEEDPPLLLLELTSSHLAFIHHSPTIAAVISFWPDHLELHGDLARYRGAKETIVRHQRAGDAVVVNADDASAGFAAATPAALVEFSLERRVEHGAYLDPARGLVLAAGGEETALGDIVTRIPHRANAVAAAAIALTAGADADAIARGIETATLPQWRAHPAGTLAGAVVVDDGMAATPAKAAALLAQHPDRSVILVAGGLNHAGGSLVHAAPAEQALLEAACEEIARAARLVIVFGEAGPRLVPLLRRRHVDVVETTTLDDAVTVAARHAAGARTVVFSPLFPVSLEDRARFAHLIARTR